MSARHLNLVTLERFAESDLDSEGMIEAGRHLSTCAPCRARLRGEVTGGAEILARLARKGWPEEESDDYDQIFERLQQKALERIEKLEEERELAPRLAEELSGLPSVEQRRRLCEDARFHSAALGDLLLERSAALAPEEPARAEDTARLALDIADRFDAKDPGQILANDLRARAWACIGNGRRIQSDFKGAETALGRAESLLEEGSGDPLERARVLDFKASLLCARRRFDQAFAAIDQVISIYRRIHDSHRLGRAFISKAMIHGYADEQEKGIPLFCRALELIDFSAEPRLSLVAHNNLLVDLVDLGRYQEGAALLPKVRELLAVAGKRPDHIKICWTEARLDAGLGRTAEAETKLRRVREQFIGQEAGYDSALASLDLVKIYLRQGRTEETKQLAAEMHTIFASREIHREALVALVFFQKAAAQESATVRLVEQVTGYLRSARNNPGLTFETPT
jgi:tetratricopeptide (TPR) repeat protein